MGVPRGTLGALCRLGGVPRGKRTTTGGDYSLQTAAAGGYPPSAQNGPPQPPFGGYPPQAT